MIGWDHRGSKKYLLEWHKNKDENVHRFAFSLTSGELLEGERDRFTKSNSKKKEKKRLFENVLFSLFSWKYLYIIDN